MRLPLELVAGIGHERDQTGHRPSRLAAFIGGRIRRSHARNAYFDAGRVYGYLNWQFIHEDAPAERAQMLRAMAGCWAAMGAAHTPAFGPDPNEDEGGRDVADSDRLSSQLLYLLADVEECAATGRGLLGDCTHPCGLTEEAWVLARRAAGPYSLASRSRLIQEFAWAVAPTVGGQAAETVFCLYPSESEEVSA